MSYSCHNWEKIDEETIQCHICGHNCLLKSGEKGFCKVRQNIDNQMQLIVYGKCCGLAIDPIEKKPLYHFYPGSHILSFGTNGCNLDCQFCQNWHLSKAETTQVTLIEATPESIASQAKNNGCKSVAFTYNEPIVFCEYVEDVAAACAKKEIRNVIVSAGYIKPEPRKRLFKNIHAANIDLKSFDDDFYRKYCSARLQPVLDTLIYLKNETNVWLEITTLLINGLNDSDEELNHLTDWIINFLGDDVPLHFSAFHGAYKMQNHPSTSVDSLKRARMIALSKGIKHVYLGNILDDESAITYCAQCRFPLIKREYFHINSNSLKNGNRCPDCNTICPGIFA